MSDPITHDYGTPNFDYISSWFERDDDGPFWALNLMKYRERAIAADGTVEERSGLEACLLYTSPSPRDRSLSRMPSSA